MTGRLQAFSLGESFAEHYGFALLNQSHMYEIEYGGTSTMARLMQINIELKRLHVGSHWGFGEQTRRIMFRSMQSQKHRV